MEKLKIAAQLYTVREYTKDIEDFKSTLKKIKDIGYTNFQYSGAGPLDPIKVKQAMDEAEIYMSATHINPNNLKNDLKTIIQQHKLWNCEFVGIGMMPEEYRTSYDNVKRFAEEFSRIGSELKKNGLTLVYHNHHFEFQKYNNKLIMDILLDESDPSAFDMELDTYWVQAGGADPVDWIYKVEGRMRYVHFKDMGIINSNQVFMPVGEGNLNWNRIIKACLDTKVEYCAIEQDICEGSPFDCLKKSYDNLTMIYNL